MKLRQILAAICVWAFSWTQVAWADADPMANLTSLVQQLQKQMEQMQRVIDQQNEKIRSIEKREPQIEVAGPGDVEKADPLKEKQKFATNLKEKIGDADLWLKDLKFSGDFRLRYEAFDFTSGHPTETDPRNRFRFRLRYGFEKTLLPDMKVGFYLSSGSTSDPTSTNETFDGNFVYKTTVIERAFATYTPSWAKIGPIEKFEITGGKFKNPFETGSSEIVWDRDVRPEGIYQKVDFRLLDMEDLKITGYATAGQFILDEDGTLGSGTKGGDAELWAVQVGLNPKFKTPFADKPISWLLAASYYGYSGYAEKSNFGAFARGNPNITGSATELDAGRFHLLELYNEVKIPLFDPLPSLRLFYDWVVNGGEDAPARSMGGADDAWAIGAKLGEAKTKGNWEIGYEYRYIDPNSVPGAFNDSDFGNGHSDKRGSVIKAKYMLTDSLELGASVFLVNNISADSILIDEEQRRFQLDLAWKF